MRSSTRNRILASSALLLVVALAVYGWWTSQGDPSARLPDEVARELARVTTVQGRLDITFQGVTLEQELWAQRPGYLRTETEQGPSAFAGTLVVLTPEEGWVYSPALYMATVVDRRAAASQEDVELEANNVMGSILERMPDRILDSLRRGTPSHRSERSEIAGRAAVRLDLVIANDDPTLPAGPLTVWLDEQYSYPLAWRDSQGRELRFRSIAFNAEIDPATFVFHPPPGASVRRVTPAP